MLRSLVGSEMCIRDRAFCRSNGRSTAAEVGRPVRSIDMHKRARQLGLVGRSTGRSTVQRALLSENGPGRPAESCCSLYPVSVDRAVDRDTTDIKMTVGPIDRAVDRKGDSALSSCQRADLFWGYKYPIPLLFSTRIFRVKIFIFLSVLTASFKRVFVPKDLIFICFKRVE